MTEMTRIYINKTPVDIPTDDLNRLQRTLSKSGESLSDCLTRLTIEHIQEYREKKEKERKLDEFF